MRIPWIAGTFLPRPRRDTIFAGLENPAYPCPHSPIGERERVRGFTPLEIKRIQGRVYKFLTGFTLIELLISISIFAVVAMVLYSSFRGGVVSWRRIDTEQAVQRRIRYLFERISLDLKNMVFLSNLPFEGEPDRISFTSLLRSADKTDIHIGRVSYYLIVDEEETAGSTIVRQEEQLREALRSGYDEEKTQVEEVEPSPPTYGEEAEARETKLLAGVSEIDFKFLSKIEGTDEDESPEYEWVDLWEDEEGLPLAIEVGLTFSPLEGSGEIKLSKKVSIPIGKGSR